MSNVGYQQRFRDCKYKNKSKNVSKNKSIDVKLYLKSYAKHDMVDKITRFIRQRGFQ